MEKKKQSNGALKLIIPMIKSLVSGEKATEANCTSSKMKIFNSFYSV